MKILPPTVFSSRATYRVIWQSICPFWWRISFQQLALQAIWEPRLEAVLSCFWRISATVAQLLTEIVSISPVARKTPSLRASAWTARTGYGLNRTRNGSKPIKNDVRAGNLHGGYISEMREPIKLCFLTCLLWLMDHFAVLTHKLSGLSLTDFLSG